MSSAAYDINAGFDYSQYAGTDYDADTQASRADRFSGFGNFIFRDEVADRLGALFYTKMDVKPVKFMLRGVPHETIGVLPGVLPRPDVSVTAEPSQLYRCTAATRVRVQRFLGPKTESDKMGLSFIDGHCPEDVRGLARHEIPPTVFTTLIARANAIIDLPQYSRFRRFYETPKRGDDFDPAKADRLWLRRSGDVFYVAVRVFATPQSDDVTFDNPVNGLLQLSRSAYESLMKCLTTTREGWAGAGMTHEQLAGRAAVIDRFGFDACNPAGAPLFSLEGSKPKRALEGAGRKASFRGQGERSFGARYEVTIDPQYPSVFMNGDLGNTVALVRETHVAPAEYLNFMSQADIATTILERSTDPEWTEFIVTCLRNTPLYDAISERAEKFMAVAEQARVQLDNQHAAEIYTQPQPHPAAQQYRQPPYGAPQYPQQPQYPQPAAPAQQPYPQYQPQQALPPQPQYPQPAAPAQQQYPQPQYPQPPAPAQPAVPQGAYAPPPPPPGQGAGLAPAGGGIRPAGGMAPAAPGLAPAGAALQQAGPAPAGFAPPPAPPAPPVAAAYPDPTQPAAVGVSFDDSALDIFRNYGSDPAGDNGEIPF